MRSSFVFSLTQLMHAIRKCKAIFNNKTMMWIVWQSCVFVRYLHICFFFPVILGFFFRNLFFFPRAGNFNESANKNTPQSQKIRPN